MRWSVLEWGVGAKRDVFWVFGRCMMCLLVMRAWHAGVACGVQDVTTGQLLVPFLAVV